jgi:hypothetical protein
MTFPAGKFPRLDVALADRCDLQVANLRARWISAAIDRAEGGFWTSRSIWRGIGRLALISIKRINPLRMPRKCQTGNEAAATTMLSLFQQWIHGRYHFARGTQEHVEKRAQSDFRQLSQEFRCRIALRALRTFDFVVKTTLRIHDANCPKPRRSCTLLNASRLDLDQNEMRQVRDKSTFMILRSAAPGVFAHRHRIARGVLRMMIVGQVNHLDAIHFQAFAVG